MIDEDKDPALKQPERIAKRLRLLAKEARRGNLKDLKELIGCAIDISADAMLARRTYETESGPQTYNAPERQHALRGIEVAATLMLKAPPLNAAMQPEEAKGELEKMGYRLERIEAGAPAGERVQ